MQRGEMGIVNGNPMGMGISIVEWEWLYGNGREWESERHSRTPLLQCICHILSPMTIFIQSRIVSSESHNMSSAKRT